jgi:hypothetical protein
VSGTPNTTDRVDIALIQRPNNAGSMSDPAGMARKLRLHAAALRTTVSHLRSRPENPKRSNPGDHTRSDLLGVDGTTIGKYVTKRDPSNTTGDLITRTSRLDRVRAKGRAYDSIEDDMESSVTIRYATVLDKIGHDADSISAFATEIDAFANAIEQGGCFDAGIVEMRRFEESKKVVSANCILEGADLAGVFAPTIESRATSAIYRIGTDSDGEPMKIRRTEPALPTIPLHRIRYSTEAELDLYIAAVTDQAHPETDPVEILRILERHAGTAA